MPEVVCPVDGTKFDIAPSHLARLKREPTCSVACKAEQMKGKGHWHWRGGTYIDAEGYRRVWTPEGHQMEHRLVMAKKLGRPLEDWELVRHKDGDRLNNKVRNLELVVTAAAPAHRRRRPDTAAERRGPRRGRSPRGLRVSRAR